MLTILRTNQFKKDYKLSKKQGREIEKLVEVIEKLVCEEKLDQKYREHALHGSYKDCRECHI
ncbi:MAG: type II toxin-antitoxin system YafQ family toxin [Bacteroidota bacterium]|nr:type II toxin-antitoxin system YafQ family toxin [Bacteroidota bacterium]